MAESILSLCDLLCFANYYAKRLTTKSVKSMIHDFYSPSVVTAAKERLQQDLTALNLDVTLPRMPSRRDSAQRIRAEIDDIFSLLDFCDLHKLHSRLPTYVSNNPEQLPQLRLEKGDVVVMVNKIDKLQEEINNLRSENMSLRCDIGRSLAAIENRLVSHTPAATRLSINPIQQPVAHFVSADSRPVGDSGIALTAASRDMDTTVAVIDPGQPAHSVSVSAANVGVNGSDVGYTTVVNNRHARRSANVRTDSVNELDRPSDNSAVAVVSQPAQRQQQAVRGSIANRRKERVVGAADVTWNGVRAARKISAHQSVFCIYNVDRGTSCEAMEAYLTNCMQIRVLSISQARVADKWRDSTVSFRVCIPTTDKDTLLNPELLPMYVGIRAWTFKKKPPNGTGGRDGALHSQGRASGGPFRGPLMPGAAGQGIAMGGEGSSCPSGMRGTQGPPDLMDACAFPMLPTRPADGSGTGDARLSGAPVDAGMSEPAGQDAASAAPTTSTLMSGKRKAGSPADNTDRSRVRVIECTASTSTTDTAMECMSDNSDPSKLASFIVGESDLTNSGAEHLTSWSQEANALDNPGNLLRNNE